MVLLAGLLYACKPKPEITIKGQISTDNGCGKLSGNYIIEGNGMTSHIEVTSTSETDTSYIYFDDILLLKAAGNHAEKDYNATISQGQHCFRLENRCGSVSDCFDCNVTIN